MTTQTEPSIAETAESIASQLCSSSYIRNKSELREIMEAHTDHETLGSIIRACYKGKVSTADFKRRIKQPVSELVARTTNDIIKRTAAIAEEHLPFQLVWGKHVDVRVEAVLETAIMTTLILILQNTDREATAAAIQRDREESYVIPMVLASDLKQPLARVLSEIIVELSEKAGNGTGNIRCFVGYNDLYGAHQYAPSVWEGLLTNVDLPLDATPTSLVGYPHGEFGTVTKAYLSDSGYEAQVVFDNGDTVVEAYID